jgi:hypothetical protein
VNEWQLCTIDAAMGRALGVAVAAVAQARPLLRKRGVDCCVVPMWLAGEGMDGERVELMQLRVVQCRLGERAPARGEGGAEGGGERAAGGAVLQLLQPPNRPRHSVKEMILRRKMAGGGGGGEAVAEAGPAAGQRARGRRRGRSRRGSGRAGRASNGETTGKNRARARAAPAWEPRAAASACMSLRHRHPCARRARPTRRAGMAAAPLCAGPAPPGRRPRPPQGGVSAVGNTQRTSLGAPNSGRARGM